MPLINGPRVFPIGESAIVPRQDYDAFDVIGAAASMTASGVLMSSLSDAKIDERTLNHFTQNPLQNLMTRSGKETEFPLSEALYRI